MPEAQPLSDPRPDIVARLDVGSALDILIGVEDLEPEATGALLVGPRRTPVGTVLVEGGRVCWAVAAGMRRRLTDILRHSTQPALDASEVETVYQRCHSEGRPLGEVLVDAGVVTAEGMRRALWQHTGEALALLSGALSEDRSQLTWVAHKQQRYDARFTFSAAELVVGLGQLRSPRLVARASQELDAHFGGEPCVAYSREEGAAAPVPVAAVGLERMTLREVLDLGRWALSTCDLTTTVSPSAQLFTVVREGGDAIVGWQADGVVYAGAVPDPSSLACVMVKRRRTARGAGP